MTSCHCCCSVCGNFMVHAMFHVQFLILSNVQLCSLHLYMYRFVRKLDRMTYEMSDEPPALSPYLTGIVYHGSHAVCSSTTGEYSWRTTFDLGLDYDRDLNAVISTHKVATSQPKTFTRTLQCSANLSSVCNASVL